MPPTRLSAVQVVPNESVVQGQIITINPDPSGKGWVWELTVKATNDVEGYPNFVKAYVGKNIQVYVRPNLNQKFSLNDSFEARVAWRGDEHGGRFTMVENGIRKI